MMERMPIVGQPGMIGHFRPEQIAQQNTWTKIPEGKRVTASIHVVHVIPKNASTETQVNPVDPGDGFYLERPYDPGRLVASGRMRY